MTNRNTKAELLQIIELMKMDDDKLIKILILTEMVRPEPKKEIKLLLNENKKLLREIKELKTKQT